MIKRIISTVCIVFLLLWMLPKLFLVRIDPWKIGVRRSLTGGITEQDFDFGYQLRIPFIHSYYHLPRTLNYLDYLSTGQAGEQGALEIRTSGNNVIFVDISVPWRIKDGEAWQIVREGFIDTYPAKVQSTTTGVLRRVLAQMTNLNIYDSDKRMQVAESITPVLNQELEQYHVVAEQVVIRAIRFRDEYEAKLQNKQQFIVQGKLDEALRKESVAKQDTDTLEKTIDKEMSLKREEWNKKIEELRTRLELQIAEVEAEAVQYDRKKRSEADAFYAKAKAEGDLAEAKAEALGEKLKAAALATKAGRTYSAITAAENFQLGEIQLNSNDPAFLQK
ncbi:MAG: SPFH domain-containing protein, partial [Myxococcota bacterium]